MQDVKSFLSWYQKLIIFFFTVNRMFLVNKVNSDHVEDEKPLVRVV